MKPTQTGSFRIDDEHMKRKRDEDMKKKKAQERVEKKKLYKRRAKLLLSEFLAGFVVLGWLFLSGIVYLVNPLKDTGVNLFILSVSVPFFLAAAVGFSWFIFSDMILPSFRNVKSDW